VAPIRSTRTISRVRSCSAGIGFWLSDMAAPFRMGDKHNPDFFAGRPVDRSFVRAGEPKRATVTRRVRLQRMKGRGQNGTNGANRKRVASKGRRATKAQQAAWRRIVAESGVTPTSEGMEAILQELRRA
jgi:hypothetical protein